MKKCATYNFVHYLHPHFFLFRHFQLNVIAVQMEKLSLFPAHKMDAHPKPLSLRSSEDKYKWWTEGLKQTTHCSGLNNNVSMTWCWSRPEEQPCALEHFTHGKIMSFSPIRSHSEMSCRWLFPGPPASEEKDSRTSSGVRYWVTSGGETGQGLREAAIANAGRFCSSGRCDATHCSLCFTADITTFRQKQRLIHRDRGGWTQWFPVSEQGILFFRYYVFFVDDYNGETENRW